MKRRSIPAAFAIVLGFCIAAAAQPSQSIRVEHIRNNLYVLKSSGANTTVFVTTTGVVVIDTMGQGQGQAILAAIKTITDKPVTTVINTGPDPEHVGGNVEFPANVEIVAQRNTKRRMQKAGIRGRALPTRTFKSKLTLFSGSDAVDLYYFGRGHTDGDTWVVFRALGVVHIGDLFPGDDLPLLDAKNGGSALEIGQTLESGSRRIKSASLVITGHGPERTWPELLEYVSFNNQFIDLVWRGQRDRKTVEDIVRDWIIPPSYEKYAPIDAARLRNNVALAVKQLDEVARLNLSLSLNSFAGSFTGSRSATDTAPPPVPEAPTAPPVSSPPESPPEQ